MNLPFAGTAEMRGNGQYQQLRLHFCQGGVVTAKRAKLFCRTRQTRTMEPDQKRALYIAARLQNRRIDVTAGNGQPLGVNEGNTRDHPGSGSAGATATESRYSTVVTCASTTMGCTPATCAADAAAIHCWISMAATPASRTISASSQLSNT